MTINATTQRSGTISGNLTLVQDGRWLAGFRIEDGAGNASTTYRELNVDLNPPTCSVTIPATHTRSRTVGISLTAADTVTNVVTAEIRNESSDWTSFAYTDRPTTWTLDAGDGTRRFYARFTDEVGHTSPTCEASVILDTRAPVLSNQRPQIGDLAPLLTTVIHADWADDTTESSHVSGVAHLTGTMTLRDVTRGLDANDVTQFSTREPTFIEYKPPALLTQTEYEVCVSVSDGVGNRLEGTPGCWRFRTP
jgi:hypothetical protein